MKHIGKILFGLLAVVLAVLWITVGFKCMLLTLGLFSLLLYFNISMTSLANAFIGRGEGLVSDVFWKILLIIVSSMSLGIFFCV